MYLVTEGTGKINQLGYDKKTSEYVFLHKGKEIWRKKGDMELLKAFYGGPLIGFSDMQVKFPIFRAYCEGCDRLKANVRGL